MNFVFDLDDMVCLAIDSKPQERLAELQQHFDQQYLDYHSMYVLGYLHLIFPGFYALFRWLDALGGNLLFFSGGVQERNTELVAQLIRRALPDKAERLLPTIKVFSREHRIRTEHLRGDQLAIQSLWWGNTKKKLEGIVVSKEELPDTVLIEDDQSYITGGEEANFILARSDSYTYFSRYSDNFKGFHKAYYLCGLFNRMLELKRTQGLSLSQAAWKLQVEDSGKEFDRDFPYPSQYERAYYEEGLTILQRYEPGLRYYIESRPDSFEPYWLRRSPAFQPKS